MSISRFSISIEKETLGKLDSITSVLQFPNRSRTIRYLIQQVAIKYDSKKNKMMAGAIILVYNHHQRELQT